MLRALILVILTLVLSQAFAKNDGRWSQLDPVKRDWLRNQIVPGGKHKGGNCCNESDGVDAQEDIRGDKYWVTFTAHGVPIPWTEVPDEAVIRAPNKYGTPVVWFWFENGQAKIKCYAPGSGI
jgi:hypothetical protein